MSANSAHPRIVVLDGHTLNPGDLSWEPLAELGELTVHDHTAPEDVVDRARNAELVLTNKASLGADEFATLDGLRYVGLLATGYDNIDLQAADAGGIVVANVPSYATDSVAQHTLALLLQLTNRIAEHDAAVRRGEWAEARDFTFWNAPLVELVGKTIGIVGLGRIGRRVADLSIAFGMNPIAYSPSLTPGSVVKRTRAVTLDELFAESDVVSLHCPLSDENHNLVNATRLGQMKKTAFFLNTARGELVDSHALAAALSERLIAGAALDVAAGEPIDADDVLLTAPNLFVTPHNAWTSVAARRRLLTTAVQNVEAFLSDAPVNVVSR